MPWLELSTDKSRCSGMWACDSKSDSSKSYSVSFFQNEWSCECEDFVRHRGRKNCKHIQEVKEVDPLDLSEIELEETNLRWINHQ